MNAHPFSNISTLYAGEAFNFSSHIISTSSIGIYHIKNIHLKSLKLCLIISSISIHNFLSSSFKNETLDSLG
jgi:hypothetical protein